MIADITGEQIQAEVFAALNHLIAERTGPAREYLTNLRATLECNLSNAETQESDNTGQA